MTHGVKAMSNTVEYKGGVYEIDGLYIGACNSLIQLKEVVNGEFKGIDSSGNLYQDGWLISVDQSSIFHNAKLGTITKAPVKLIDGEAYQFNYNDGSQGMNNAVMRYREAGDHFFFDNTIFKREHCDNIQHLTVGEK